MKRVLLLLIACLAVIQSQAQQKITVSNLKSAAPYEDFMSGLKGLRIDLDLLFSVYPENYMARSFELDFVLVTKQGELVFDSKSDHTVRISATQNTDTKVQAAMTDTDVKLFAPYKDIKLPTGTHTVFLIISLKNEYGNFPDIHKTEITFLQEYKEQKKFAEQVFKLDQPVFNFAGDGFGTDDPGMDVKFLINLAYGADQVDTKNYTLNLKILSLDGSKVLYSSASDPSIHHRTQSIATEDFPGESKSVKFFVNYVELKLNQAGEALVVLEAEQPGAGKREIYREKHFINSPTKYRFADQVFTPSVATSGTGERDGVAGIGVNFHCNYKYNTPLIDNEKGDFYFFIVFQNAKGDTVFSPTYLRRVDYETTSAWNSQNPLHQPNGSEINFFLPFHRLRLAQGTHSLKYTVFVSDKTRKVKFPVVQTGTVSVEMPKKYKYEFALTYLSVIDGNYDTQIAMFGSTLPDLEWRLELGEDTEYQSKTLENSLNASTGTSMITLCEGDKVSLGLWDIDSGFFNRNDIMGRWEIPTKFEGESYKHSFTNQGVINTLHMTISRK